MSEPSTGTWTRVPSESIVASLVERCLREREVHGEAVAEVVCREHPDLLERVRATLAAVHDLPALHGGWFGQDGRVGQVLADRYLLEARVGSGAMGVVYAAQDLELGRRVAVKVMHTTFVDAERAMERFEREAAILASVQHPAIVTIHDRGVTPSAEPYFVMEFVEGASLADLIVHARVHAQDDRADWLASELGIEGVQEASFVRQSTRWIAEAAAALRAAHLVGVTHRDIKPTNLMVRRDGRIVLIDFGVAARDRDPSLTRTNEVVGTLAYMAPEAVLGQRSEGAQLDLYGLAATLYNLWTLQPPYRGTAAEVVAAIATRSPVPAQRLRRGLSTDAQAVLDHGLARSPRHRYRDLGVFESDLTALLAHRPVSVKPTSYATQVLRRLQRSRAALTTLTVALCVGLGFSAWRVDLHWIRAREAQDVSAFAGLWPRVPANFAISSPQFRKIDDPAQREAVRAVLDGLVATGERGLQALALRALMHADHGDGRAAAADMALLAGAHPTGYVEALAASYAAASTGADLDLSGLPAPEDGLDRYLAGLHALRAGDLERATSELATPAAQDIRHGAELALLLRLVPLAAMRGEDQAAARHGLAEGILDDLRALELKSGVTSAMSAHLRAVALLRQGLWRRAFDASEASLELAPTSHPAAQNAAEAAYHLGLYEASVTHARAALALAPDHAPLLSILAKSLVEAGRPSEAREVVSSTEFGDSASGRRNRASLAALVELAAAMHSYGQDLEAARAAAADAAELARGLPASSKTRARILAYAESILADDPARFDQLLLEELAESPTSAPLLGFLAARLPSHLERGLDANGRAALSGWVRGLREQLSAPSWSDPQPDTTPTPH